MNASVADIRKLTEAFRRDIVSSSTEVVTLIFVSVQSPMSSILIQKLFVRDSASLSVCLNPGPLSDAIH